MSYERKKAAYFMKYPAIQDLRTRAKKRMPHVAWEYLETGTGSEELIALNTSSFSKIRMPPQFCLGQLKPKIETNLFGKTYSAPFGVAPVGLTGLMWPETELILAKTAKKNNIPYSLSTVATETPERVGPHVGENGWFQLYPPREKELRRKFIERAKQNGFHTLLITADVPTPSRRERTKRAGLQMPPKITPHFLWQGITHPEWSINTLKRGLPRLRMVESYAEFKTMMSVGSFVRGQLGGNLSWDICKEIRDMWDGPVLVKGILHPKDAEEAIRIGLDGIGVSNHGGRQFDGAPASIDVLPEIVNVAKGKAAIIFDSGIRSGLDILRALYLGADFVLLGRAFIYGVAALGDHGGDHVYEILCDELQNNMIQFGVEDCMNFPLNHK